MRQAIHSIGIDGELSFLLQAAHKGGVERFEGSILLRLEQLLLDRVFLLREFGEIRRIV